MAVAGSAPHFGALLRPLRLKAGLTQDALAEKAGLSAKAISDLERDPDLVLNTIARHVGAREQAGTSLHEQLVEALRNKHLLLLLDNFEQVVSARETVLALLVARPRLVAP